MGRRQHPCRSDQRATAELRTVLALGIAGEVACPQQGDLEGIEPVRHPLAAEYAGKVTVGKLNVDENPNVSFKFQIRGIPTILIFKGGQVVESVVGLAQKEDLKKVIDKHI